MSSGKENEPNLTPILDMVFQLITFFMLVVSFKNVSVDRDLKLPAIARAVAVDARDASNQIVLNINAKGELSVFGVKRDDVEKFVNSEAKQAMNYAKKENPAYKPGDELPATVVLRVSEDCDYGALDRTIRTCQEHNFRRFSFNSSVGLETKRK